jgi:hypothetical protein
MTMRFRHALVCFLIVGLVAWIAKDAQAGARELEVLFVNMTPDALSGGDSKTCVEAIKKQIKKEDTKINKLGESKLRKAAGVEKGGAPFVTWKPKQFKSLIYPSGTNDVIVLIDCRPEQEHLDILMLTTRLRPIAISYRRRPSPMLLKAVTRRLLAHAWDGFRP